MRGAIFGIGIGVAAVSTAALFIRLAEVPPLVAATYRLGIATVVLLPVALAVHGRRGLDVPRRTKVLLSVSGAALAAHFGFWIASLSYTSVASSVFLVTSNPILVALLSTLLLRERPRPLTVLGIIVALSGGALITGSGLALGGRALLGNGLALLGAVAITAYYLVGRVARSGRAGLPLLVYTAWVYGTAFLIVAAGTAASGQPVLGYPWESLRYLVLLGLVPQVVGHSALNWALQTVPATLVAAAVMAEPVLASALAALFLGETPTLQEVIGGGLILSGVFLAYLGGSHGPGRDQ